MSPKTPDKSAAIGGDHPFRRLLQWFWPYVQGSRRRFFVTVVIAIVVLACQAVIPLQVESILSKGVWSTGQFALLTGLVFAVIVGLYGTELGAKYVATQSAERLRQGIFAQALRVRVIRRDGLVRSSIVSRHTSDVDNVSEAFSTTVSAGLPAVARVTVSLALLTFVEWHAGVVMIMATIAFVQVRRVVGRSLIEKDQERMSASSRVGESVDEAITSPRTISGLHLETWVESRFAQRINRLTTTTLSEALVVTQLVTGAYAAGMLGLLAVVVFGVAAGGVGLASVAAALLYVEGVVAGLRVLPDWIRSLQLAVVSRYRIDMILNPNPHTQNPDFKSAPKGQEIAWNANIQIKRGHLVGLVTPVAVDRDVALASLSAGLHPDPWRITMDGTAIRMPEVIPETIHVPADSVAFNVSVHEHLRSLSPELSDENATEILKSVGLGHLADLPAGLNQQLGPMAGALTADERQRLMLATAMAARPQTLLVGPLIALADPDTAQPLLNSLRESGIGVVVVALRSPETAAAMDSMVWIGEHEIRHDSHEYLLVDSPEYARLWGQRLAGDEVDLSVLGLGDDAHENLHARLVTERYAAGDVIYRQGDLSDRIFFVVSGRVEVSVLEGEVSRRVAVIGPGNHCGDLRLTVSERRAESARAVDTCVVRSLSRGAISAGLTGLLDRTPTERRIVTNLLRNGPSSVTEIQERLTDVEPGEITSAIALLLQDGAVRESGDAIHVVVERRGRKSSKDFWDRLGN